MLSRINQVVVILARYTLHEIPDLLKENSKIYGDIFKMRFGGGYIVYINHPDDAKILFQAKYGIHKRIVFDINVILAKRLNVVLPNTRARQQISRNIGIHLKFYQITYNVYLCV